MSGDSTLRILLVTSDKFPPFRPAAKAIFGEELTGRGHIIDWVMPASDPVNKGGPQRYGTGTVYLAASSTSQSRIGRLVKHLREFNNDMRVFSLARKQSYDVIQVKDRYMAAVLSLIAALNKNVIGSRQQNLIQQERLNVPSQPVNERITRYFLSRTV